MRIAYLDCFAGIAGDMFLGALVQAGVPVSVLEEATAALGLGASLKVETVDRSGISSVKVHVMEGGQIAEDVVLEQKAREGAKYSQLPRTQHLHKVGHEHEHPHEHPHTHEHSHSREDGGHDHTHEHVHGRSLTEIRALILAAKLEPVVKDFAVRTFELLGESEAKIHNVPVDAIHFHEVGAVDAIVDIVAASAGVHHLGVGKWYASAVNVGGGMIECAHGTFPVPAPATADLLRGFPTYSAHVQKELVTPTGAALLRALAPTFGVQPAMRVSAIGYGAGTRNPRNFPNVLRLSVGESEDVAAADAADTVAVVETALDDLSPQVIAHVAEAALAAGALDVMLTPVTMKKGRPGTLMTVLAKADEASKFAEMLLRETSTLGVRVREERRVTLERRHVAVETQYGTIRVKVGFAGESERNAAPEFEDCKLAAAKHGVPLKQVQAASMAAYASGSR